MKYLSTCSCMLLITIALTGCVDSKPTPPVGPVISTGNPSNTTNSENTDPSTENTTAMTTESTSFGKTAEGDEITLWTINNGNGIEMKVTNFGAIITSLSTPDKEGNSANINAGFDTLAPYFGDHPYFGSTVGRYANRIAGGKFSLDGKEYTLATNNDPNHLHGGDKGFNKRVWTGKEIVTGDGHVGVEFSYHSVDGEEGYPGNLDVVASFTLSADNELHISHTATTDAATVINLTNHNYWNLAGIGSGTNYEHVLKLESDKFLAVDDTLIPTGEYTDVKGTVMDFTSPTAIGKGIQETGGDPIGYDHCYVLRSQTGELALAATVTEPVSGRIMEVYTTEPGIQLYSGNFLDGSEAGAGLKQHEAFCLETQHYPDSPNQESFPTTVLKPGETYSHKTVHKFKLTTE
ncbi:MAG: aldose epimerase family protein [Pirellulales bacterium]